ncbi:MAG: porin, partial [Planctomycetes bacterium]|nr:porin [Planctomycetota bacterium]
MNAVRWILGLAVLAYYAAPAMAQQSSTLAAFNYNLEEEQAADAPAADAPAAEEQADSSSENCGDPACGCEDASCGCGGGCGLLGDCCLGDAWTLKENLSPCCDVNYGGWFQTGYHSDNTGLSNQFNDLLDFNDVPDQLNMHQAWLYGEKLADGSCCSWDWGYRFDVVYGTDAQKTQAFGNEDNVWDVSFDNGEYGWAIPQAYAQLAYGDWSFKIGHFFTLVGYEVVPATGNFFYSHALTFYNSEPFTHTGVLGSYEASDRMTYHLGWVLGWDTGYDQYGNGNAIHTGFTRQASDDVSVSYMLTAGNFGFRSGDEGGYSHSVVVTADLNACTQYVLQTDYIHTDGLYGDPTVESEDYGINQYLFYTLNDCWKLGSRLEWWKSDQ